MIDICTLTVVTVMTLEVCVTKPICEEHDGRLFCTSAQSVPCRAHDPHYECVRPDGSRYVGPWATHPSFEVKP